MEYPEDYDWDGLTDPQSVYEATQTGLLPTHTVQHEPPLGWKAWTLIIGSVILIIGFMTGAMYIDWKNAPVNQTDVSR